MVFRWVNLISEITIRQVTHEHYNDFFIMGFQSSRVLAPTAIVSCFSAYILQLNMLALKRLSGLISFCATTVPVSIGKPHNLLT